jgi:hypothetical protein
VIVRADLPKGIQAAQVIHAAGESSPGSLPDGTYAIALSVPDERALAREAERLRARGFVRMEPRAAPAARPRSFWERCVAATRQLGRLLLDLVWPPAEIERMAFVPIYEPDPPYHGALMAIGVVPARKEALRRHLSSLPMLK